MTGKYTLWWREEQESEDCEDCGATGRIECSTCQGDYKHHNLGVLESGKDLVKESEPVPSVLQTNL